jgi:hypothetical protein
LVLILIAAYGPPVSAAPRAPRSRPADKNPPASAGEAPVSPGVDHTSNAAKVTAPRGARGVRVTIESDDETVVLEGQALDAARAPTDAGAGQGGRDEGAAPAAAPGTAADEVAEVPLPLDDGRWEVMCSPPCKRRLPRAALFRITGTGVTTSATFSLPARRSEVTLEVDTGTARWYWAGLIAAIAGGTFIVGSVGPRLAMGGSFTTVEKVMAGAGLVLVGGGAPLWWFNRTRVGVAEPDRTP